MYVLPALEDRLSVCEDVTRVALCVVWHVSGPPRRSIARTCKVFRIACELSTAPPCRPREQTESPPTGWVGVGVRVRVGARVRVSVSVRIRALGLGLKY